MEKIENRFKKSMLIEAIVIKDEEQGGKEREFRVNRKPKLSFTEIRKKIEQEKKEKY